MRLRVVGTAIAAIGLALGAARAQGPVPTSVAAAPPATPASAPTPSPAGRRLAPGTPIPPAELEALVDGVVREAMTRDHIAGLTVAIVQNGQVVLKKGYGFAGPNRPVDPDSTLFRIGSISKTFTWIAVMKEVEAGRMRLDAPINAYLPANLRIPDEGFSHPIRVIDLMTHQPGFEDNALEGLFAKDPARVPSLEEHLASARPRRVREPGTVVSYSNYGAALAGAAVAHLEGRPFPEVVEREITGPLGMTHTTFREPYRARTELPTPMDASLAHNASVGYRWTNARFEAQPFEFVTGSGPAGAGSSTAGDMARYMLMILGDGSSGGVTVYSPATAAGFRTRPASSRPGFDSLDHGFMDVSLPGGLRGYGHGGDTLWFHSLMATAPDLKLGIFASTNTETGAPFIQTQLAQRIIERFYAATPAGPLPGTPSLAKMSAVYDGTYLVNRRRYDGIGKFMYMIIGAAQVSVTPDGRLVVAALGGGPAQAYVATGRPDVLQAVDGPERIAFDIEDGRAVRLYPPLGVVALDRIGPIYQAKVLAIVAAAAIVAALSALIGLAVRAGRSLPQSAPQRRANVLQIVAAALWLASCAALVVFASGASNQAKVIFGWPSPWIVAFSALALAAAAVSAVALVLTPLTWARGEQGWTIGRKLRFSATSVIFALLGLQLALWGALEPWTR